VGWGAGGYRRQREKTMATVEDLQSKFGIDGLVSVGPGKGGLTFVKLTSKSSPAKACIYLFGAHVTTWVDAQGHDRLFLSESAQFNGKKALRGGIPVCFPQFAKLGPLAQHGFARISFWEIASTGVNERDDPYVEMKLTHTNETLELWDHKFDFRLKITLENSNEGSLACDVSVQNLGTEFEFTMALHSYFNISHISKTRVSGLSGIQYQDSLQDKKLCSQDSDLVTFEGEVDRVYLKSTDTISIDMGEQSLFPSLRMYKYNLPEAVVWNPHIEKSKGMGDLEDDAWQHFCCVEPAIADSPVKLAPEQTFTARLTLQ